MAQVTTPQAPKHNITQFADDVLHGIGAPITPQNRATIYVWVRGEGTTAQNNPLATTQDAPGATSFNSSGVKNYPSYQEGVQATIQTLKNGRYNGIVSDLQKGNKDPYYVVTDNASEFNTWGTTANLLIRIMGGKPIGKASPFDVGSNFKQGASDIGTGAKNLVEKPIDKLAMEALYGLAMALGIVIILTGFVLIGADIGIAVLGRTRAAKTGTVIVNNISPARRRDNAAYKNRSYNRSREGMSKKESTQRKVPTGIGRRPQKPKEEIPF